MFFSWVGTENIFLFTDFTGFQEEKTKSHCLSTSEGLENAMICDYDLDGFIW